MRGQRRTPWTLIMASLETHPSPATRGPQDTCRQCGTCCRKGGPALHLADRRLVMEGLIPAEALYTLRDGEPVQDNVAGRPAFAEGDIVKIKGNGSDWCCRYLEDEGSRCAIYERRPVECRALQCWDTRAIEALYDRERLTRRDLLVGVAGLWDLVADHDRRCAYRTLRDQAGRLGAPHPQRSAAIEAITGMLQYDENLRNLLVEGGHAPPGMLDFLLGRPLIESLHGFNIRVERTAGRIRLRYSLPA